MRNRVLQKTPENYTAMKNIKTTLTGLFVFALSLGVFGQPPPPNEHGLNDNQDGPLTGALIIFTLIGAGYGGLKIYKIRKSDLKQMK